MDNWNNGTGNDDQNVSVSGQFNSDGSAVDNNNSQQESSAEKSAAEESKGLYSSSGYAGSYNGTSDNAAASQNTYAATPQNPYQNTYNNAQNPYGAQQNPYGSAQQNTYGTSPQSNYTQPNNNNYSYGQGSYNQAGGYNQAYPNYNQQSYQGSGYSPVETEEPVAMGEWMLLLVLLNFVPCIGTILAIVWAFGKTEKISKSNFCKAYLIIWLIKIVLSMIIFIIYGSVLAQEIGGL